MRAFLPMKAIERIAPDVGWLPISFVNTYFVGRPGDPWALIDAGWPGRTSQIFEVAEARFGAGSRPEAIYLTHGHFDHRGSAGSLAEKWDVPIYAHRMELPYLSGRSAYPPPDPTIGGAIAFLSRFTPSGAARSGGAGARIAGRGPAGAGWLALDRDARTFARSRFLLSFIRSGAPGGRCFRNHEHGFVDGIGRWENGAVARWRALQYGLGRHPSLGAKAGRASP